MKILDCTLRDGGYYTNWDFDKDIVDVYAGAMSRLPVEWVEIGYRSKPGNRYMGQYAYCPMHEIRRLRGMLPQTGICVMLDEKGVRLEDIEHLMDPVRGLVDMVRLAVDPENLDRAVALAGGLKALGFQVGVNAMYMSKWDGYHGFLDRLVSLDGKVDLFCMVDSFGGVFPDDVRRVLDLIRPRLGMPIGFHGHDNIQMGLANALAALENGAEVLDATVLGMGRGAGNLKLELLLSVLSRKSALEVDFNVLGRVVSSFESLREEHRWGTSLPYMISGVNSFPQKEVMEWVCDRVYPFNSIVRALDNRRISREDNLRFPVLPSVRFGKILIVGGGDSVNFHADGLRAFLLQEKIEVVIHASAKNAAAFVETEIPQYFCLMGGEGDRLSRALSPETFRGVCVLPPFPRKMGTDIPDFVCHSTFEVVSIGFTTVHRESCTALALQLAVDFEGTNVYVAGYDGYGKSYGCKQRNLTGENETLFELFASVRGVLPVAVTPTLYRGLKPASLYESL